jgi:hypothetical protein
MIARRSRHRTYFTLSGSASAPDGDADGLADGEADGEFDGDPDADAEGLPLGLADGELAAASGLEAPAVARRLKAMGVRGLIMMVAVRPCSVRTTMCQAWRAR